jgi:hypothetical protein
VSGILAFPCHHQIKTRAPINTTPPSSYPNERKKQKAKSIQHVCAISRKQSAQYALACYNNKWWRHVTLFRWTIIDFFLSLSFLFICILNGGVDILCVEHSQHVNFHACFDVALSLVQSQMMMILDFTRKFNESL